MYNIYTGRYNVGTPVYCDLETHNGGWITFMRRSNADVDFKDKKWHDYKKGFGNITDDTFWYGNEIVYRLTQDHNQVLLLDFETSTRDKLYLEYKDFWLGSENDYYDLNIGSFDGNTQDGLKSSRGANFATTDKDTYNTMWGTECAKSSSGGWWYNEHNCQGSHLTGYYNTKRNGTDWKGAYPYRYPIYIMKAEMKFRPMDFQ